LDASLLRWWDGATWSKQTMPADAALSGSANPAAPLTAVPPLLTAVPRPDDPYVPTNSVFKLAESAAGEDYVPEWSGFSDISPEVALSGVPVQLALTSASSEPPIPVSADAFPMLRNETPVTAAKDPVWKVEAPLAKPIDQLFPVSGPPAAAPAPGAAAVAAAFAAPPAAPVAPLAPVAATPVPQPFGGAFPGIVPSVEPVVEPAAAEAAMLATLRPAEVPAAPAPAAPVAAPPAVPAMFAEPPASLAPPAAAFMPAAPQPVMAEPVMAQPAMAQPVVAQPVMAEPVMAQPVMAQPAMAQPVVAQPVMAEPVMAQPVMAQPVMAQPVMAQPAMAQPVMAQPVAYAEPAPAPVATPPMPQPLQLSAPIAPATPSELVPAMPSVAPAMPGEYWPTQGTPPPNTQYQPNPGEYVPFDPNSVHLEPVPVIPFSSRDPFNSASTARPGLRAYAAAPIGPSGSTWTGGLGFMLLAPLLTTAAYFVWMQLTPLTQVSASSASWLLFAIVAIFVVGLASAQLDRSALARRGYFDLASPFWVLLIPPLIYLIVRALRLRGQGRGAGAAIGLWVLSYAAGSVLLSLISVGWLSTPTPERVAAVESTIQQQLATKNITAKVSCPAVTSFSPGTSFDCTITPQQGSPLTVRITMTDWAGDFTAAAVTSSTS